MKDLDIKNKDKKKIKIEFQNPVGCLINPTGGEMLSECYHKQYPPRFGECHSCLASNFHKKKLLNKWGSESKILKMTNKGWQPQEEEFKKLPSFQTEINKPS